MYPVKLGYGNAQKRIRDLLKNSYNSEALVTSVFTVEKTLRRTLRQLIVSTGFTSKQADQLMSNIRGLATIKKSWGLYDPQNRNLVDLIGNDNWQVIKDGSKMRNDLVHGIKVYGRTKCRHQAESIIVALDNVKGCFDNIYGYSGWKKYKKRSRHRLHLDPKVNIS